MPYYYELQIEFTDNEGNFVDDPYIIASWDQGKRDDYRSGIRSNELKGDGFRKKFFETFDGFLIAQLHTLIVMSIYQATQAHLCICQY